MTGSTPAPIAPWTRRNTTATGRIADVVLVAFHEGPLGHDDLVLSAARFGSPSGDAVRRVDVTAIQDPAWLAGWRSGGIRNVATPQLGAAMAALDRADRCHLVRVTVADPADLTYLQAAWAIARWLVARGASIVLDVYPISFHTAASVAAQDVTAGFDPEREFSVIFETEPAAAKLGHVVHTRGLGKVARPDLVALVEPARAPATSKLLTRVAAALADGFMPAGPGARPPGIAEAVTLSPLPPEGSLAEALHLNNEAWLVEIDAAAS